MLKRNYLLPKVWLKLNRIKYGKSIKLIGWPFIYRFKNAEITLGDRVKINSSFFSNLLGLWQRTIIVAKGNARIVIGDDVGISGATIYSWTSVIIGDHSLIGANVKIIDTDFHPIDSEDRIQGKNERAQSKSIEIGKNVFIGMGAVILKGTIIGDNSVVGAGAVVSGMFEANSVIVGNPARAIR